MTPRLELDLTEFLGKLSKHAEERKIGGLIRKCMAAAAVLSDLARAQAALEMLATIDAEQPTTLHLKAQDDVDGLLGQSLFTLAVTLYARAVQSETKHRASVPVQKSYSEELKAAHDRAMALRNDAIAHYGPGGGSGAPRPWSEERAVVEVQGGIPSMYFPSVRANYIGANATDLRKLVEAADLFCRDYIGQAQVDVLAAIHVRALADGDFRGRLFSCPFDANAFFEGSPAASDAAAGISRSTTVHRRQIPI